jgi:hypothetical protein
MPDDIEQNPKPRERMGFERPMNFVWLLLLFAATWALWSWQAAVILLMLLIAATAIGVKLRRGKT